MHGSNTNTHFDSHKLGVRPKHRCDLFTSIYGRLKVASLEPLIDLLAYLEPKLWFKTPVFDKIQSFKKGVICPLRVNFGQP